MRKVVKLLRLLRKRTYIRGLLRGAAATVEHEPALRHLSPTTIIDIGAHHGQFALLCRDMFPKSQIHSFEPFVKSARVYHRVHDGDKHTTLCISAVGDTSGDVDLYVSKKSDSSSLLPIAKLQTDIFPGTGLKETTKVGVAPLRELIDYRELAPPILLKVDVQGYELRTLAGCADLLPDVAAVYVEASYAEFYDGQATLGEVVEFLQGAGFRFTGLYNPIYNRDDGLLQADLMFLRLPALREPS